MIVIDGSPSISAIALFTAAGFTIVAIGQEFWRGTVARRSLSGEGWGAAFGSLITRNRRRYGGYVVHVGIVLSLIGIAASSSFQTSRDLRLEPGQSAKVGDYTVTYVRPTSHVDTAEQKLSLGSIIDVSRAGKPVTRAHALARLLRVDDVGSVGAAAELLRRARRRARSAASRVRRATSGRRCSPT